MKRNHNHVTLSNGLKMPMFGIGTTHNQGGIDVESLKLAFRYGVRLIDTAKRYGSETIVRSALKSYSTPKEGEEDDGKNQFFITSKLWPGDVKGKGSVKRCYENSCRAIGVKKLDLYLVHWPGVGARGEDPDEARRNVWMEMEELYKSGSVGAIGVSNFERKHFLSIEKSCTVVPMVNQIEFNPFQNPKDLRKYCSKQGILVEGYCPFGKGEVFRNPKIIALSKTFAHSDFPPNYFMASRKSSGMYSQE